MDIPQEPQPQIKSKGVNMMAYGGNDGGTTSATYRLERGFPYTRAGQVIAPIPKFKALYLYTLAARQVPQQFRVTMTPIRVKWPVSNLPNATTGT